MGMLIWLLAVVLLASLAGLGYRQGVVRVAFSLVGILLGALLAGPLGNLVKPLLKAVGVKNPVLLWVLGPLIVFLVISIIFKVAALAAHQKVDVYYKYHAGDLRLAMWDRLNRRLGLCLGLVNGAAYLILISFVIYAFSYWTVQMATSETDPWPVRRLNSLGQDLESTGFAKVARAVAPMKESYYDTADLAGLLYNNSLLEARMYRYPAFLGLAERPEFQELANDKDFTEMRQRREPVMTVLKHPKAQAIVGNADLMHSIWTTLAPDLKDLLVFLETGKSPKYDSEKILGRWKFDVAAALGALHRLKPNITSSEMQKQKKAMTAAYARTSLVAMTDKQAILKNLPRPGAAGGPGDVMPALQGHWKDQEGRYQLTFPFAGKEEGFAAAIENDRLNVSGQGLALVFTRED